MLLKAQLTSHSRMSDSRSVTTPLWLFGSLRPFLYSSVYSCHFFLTSSAFARSLQFLSFIVPIFAWNIPLISSTFLKRSLIFPILLCSTIYFHFSLKNSFLFSRALHSVGYIFSLPRFFFFKHSFTLTVKVFWLVFRALNKFISATFLPDSHCLYWGIEFQSSFLLLLKSLFNNVL